MIYFSVTINQSENQICVMPECFNVPAVGRSPGVFCRGVRNLKPWQSPTTW